MRYPILALVLVLGLAAIWPATARAQVVDLTPDRESVIALEWSKPFVGDSDLGFATSSLLFRSLFRVSDRTRLVGDLGISHARFGGTSATSLSNLEVGVVVVDAEADPVARFTASLPTASDLQGEGAAAFTGALGAPLRLERYLPDLWAVSGFFTPTKRQGARQMGLRLGGTVLRPDGGDTEVLARYGAWVRGGGSVRFGVEVHGQAILTQDDLSLGERTDHEIVGTLGFGEGGIRPDLFVRVPLVEDGFGDAVDLVAGIRLTF